MKKRYFWIYVLPVLMVTTIIGFVVLGINSAVYEQKMQEELAKIEWKMEPIETYESKKPYYESYADVIEVVCYDKSNHWVGKRFFSSSSIELNWEEADQRLRLNDEQNRENQDWFYFDSSLPGFEKYDGELLDSSFFSEGLALLYFEDHLVCVDREYNIVFEKKAHIESSYVKSGTSEENVIKKGINTEGFHEGLAVFTLDGCRYGILDREGNVLIEPVFKGKDTFTVMKNQNIAFFYGGEFRIGEIAVRTGGKIGE